MILTTHLRSHLDELSEKMWTLIPIEREWGLKLQQMARLRLQLQLFRPAELAASRKVEAQVRNDQIFWLDAKSNSLDAAEMQFLNALEQLKADLKTGLRIYLESVECHYAFYEKGHYYQRHKDITLQNNKRIFSFVIYLNESWQDQDGGHLMAYQDQEVLFKIKPESGQMIIFRSDLEHEVKPTFRDRLSLTGWFRQ